MIKHSLLYCSIVLAGCSSTQFDPSTIDGKTFTFVPHLYERKSNLARGYHVLNPDTGIHHIFIDKDKFPECLEHEILHVLFGDWHKGRTSIEYCEG